MDALTDIELAWAAGFLDGEGCFGLHKTTGKNLHPTTRSPWLSVSQKRKGPLEKLAQMFGGNIHAQVIQGGKFHAWQWCRTGACLTEIIPVLMPHLVLKHREAAIVLSYAETVKRRGRVAIPDEVLTLRARLIEEMAAERRDA